MRAAVLFVILLSLFLVLPQSASAQYSCGVCSNGGAKTCSDQACTLNCNCAPVTGSLTMSVGQPEVCVDGACNGKDTMVDLDVTNHNQKVTISATFLDPDTPTGGRLSDIQNAYINFDLNNVVGGEYYQVAYNDTGAGQTFTYNGSRNAEISASNSSANFNAGTLTLQVTLDLVGITTASPFLANGYLQTSDFVGAGTANDRKIGTGAFLEGDDPYSGNPANALDFWNGKELPVAGGFYLVNDAADICVADKSGLTPVSESEISLDVTYTPAGGWSNPIATWVSGSPVQPFNYYGNNDYKVDYKASTTSTYFLVSMDNQRYGGTCPHTVTAGTVNDVVYKEGGKRIADNSRSTAGIGVKQISNTWSQTFDANYFSATSIDPTIETATCPTCYFMENTNSPTNGLPIVNGVFGVTINSQYGSPTNWYAEEGGTPTDKPFALVDKPTHSQLKALFDNAGASYTNLTGNQSVSTLSPAPSATTNNIYFISGNLTVDAATSVDVGYYTLYVVAGNLTVNSDINSMQGIFIVQGSATIDDDGVANYDPDVHTDQFTLDGSLTAGGTLTLNRTMGVGNNTAAPVIINARPDMLKTLLDGNVVLAQKQKLWLGEL